MEHLRQSDVGKLRAFLGRIYSLHDHGAFVQGLLEALIELVQGEVAAYAEIQADFSDAQVWFLPAKLGTLEYVRKWKDHVRDHPLTQFYQATRESRAYALSSLMTQEENRQQRWYREIYQPIGQEDALAFLIAAGSSLVLGAAVLRSRWGFTEQELMLMNLARPHLLRARENALVVSSLQGSAGGEEGGVGHEAIALSPTAEVRFASALAWRLMETYAGPRPPGGERLPERIERWVLAQTQSSTAPLLLEHGEARLELHLMIVFPGKVLVLEERKVTLRATAVERLHLTSREGEVLAWVAEGKTNGEIAIILALSARTVDKHLQRILAKLNVETRTAAAAILLAADKP
jgi:DNA-binding CsgD family transcriptional regulator